MAVYSIDQILRDARCMLDENSDSSELAGFDDTETLDLSSLIRSRVCEAVRYVHVHAPIVMLESKSFATSKIEAEPIGNIEETGVFLMRVFLPDDFLRLVFFKLYNYQRGVTVAYLEGSNEYNLAKSGIPGLMGSSSKPLCLLTVTENGGKELECYSMELQSTRVDKALYMPIPKVEVNTESGEDEIAISVLCYDAFLYYLCSLVLRLRNEQERSLSYFNHCLGLLKQV